MISFHNFYQDTWIQDLIYSFLSLTTKKNPKRPRKHYKYYVLVLRKESPGGRSEEAKEGKARGEGSYGGSKPVLLFERLNL